MTMQIIFNIIATLIILLLGCVWNRDDIPNLAVKATLINIAAGGFFLIMESLGYIVKL